MLAIKMNKELVYGVTSRYRREYKSARNKRQAPTKSLVPMHGQENDRFVEGNPLAANRGL
jgi:hypothetical protein